MAFTAQSCLKDFNNIVEKYLQLKYPVAENDLNCCISLVDSSKDQINFCPESIETTQFYIYLHGLMENLHPKSNNIELCISILQVASENLETRQAIANRFRFLPILSKILPKIESQEKLQPLLNLIQNLSYVVEIPWEEQYLHGLIEILVEFTLKDEEKIMGNTALSILTNLCYSNAKISYILSRCVDFKTFYKKIPEYGAIGTKMQIILDTYIDMPNITQLLYFIKQSFTEIHACLRKWDIPRLSHIIRFLSDAQNSSMTIAMKEYKDFCAEIKELIKILNQEQYTQNYNEDSLVTNNCALAIGLIFDLINYIYKFDNSLKILSCEIFALAKQSLDCTSVLVKSLKIITTILEKADSDCKAQFIGLDTLLISLVQKSENRELNSEQMIEFFQLLLVLFHKQSTRNLVITVIKESYYDRQFASLFDCRIETIDYKNYTIKDISKYLHCLMLLVEFSNYASEIWLSKLQQLFKISQIQFIIAKSLVSGDEKLIEMIFEISKINGFPKREISAMIINLRPFKSTDDNSMSINNTSDNSSQFSSMILINKLSNCGRFKTDKVTEAKIDELISYINEKNRDNDCFNIATSELIELFNYKMRLFNDTEKNLTQRLEEASNTNTHLCHRISLQSEELTLCYKTNFDLRLTLESLQSEIIDLKKQRDCFKNSINETMKELKTVKLNREALESKSRSEIEGLRKELDKYISITKANEDEIKKLQSLNTENAIKIENLKKSNQTYEGVIKENKQHLSELEKELNKSTKMITELKESNAKSENIIKHLQIQLEEKIQRIQQCEEELKETEELRNTIITLMQPKRKNNTTNSKSEKF